MRLDDRTAYRQSHTQAVGLGRVEGVEEPVQALGLQAWAGILYCDKHATRTILLGSDQQLPLRLSRSAHRFYGVENHVYNQFLKLNVISSNDRKSASKMCLQQGSDSTK